MSTLANLTTYIGAENANLLSTIESSRGGLRKLLAEIDPLAAATLQYNKKVDLLTKAFDNGKISADQFARGQEVLKAKLDDSAERIQKYGAHVGSARAAQMELTHVVKASADQFAAGAPPLQIMTMHLAQLAQAASMSGGSMGKFGEIMSGGWGIAITGAIVLAGALVTKLLEGEDAIGKETEKLKKNAEQTEVTRLAQEAYRKTTEGMIEDSKRLVEQLDKQILTERQLQNQAVAKAQQSLNNLKADRDKITNDLPRLREEARKARAEADREQYQEGGGLGYLAMADDAERAVAAQEGRLKNLNKQIADAARGVREAQLPIMEAQTTDAMDAAAAATDKYTDALGRLRQEFARGIITEKQFNDQDLKNRQDRDAAIKAANDAKAAAARGTDADSTHFQSPVHGTITGRFGDKRPGHLHAGVDVAVPVGTEVDAAAAGTVIEAGNLPGYGNVVIIDHGRGTITRYAHLSKIGVTKGQVVDAGSQIGLSGGAKAAEGAGDSTGPHLHYEVRRNGRAVNPLTGNFPTDPSAGASRAVETAEAKRQRELAEAAAYMNDELGARRRLSAAAKKNADSEEERYALIRDDINAQADVRNSNVEARASAKKISVKQAEHLIKLNEQTRSLELQNANDAQQAAANKMALRFSLASLGNAQGLLRSELDAATTRQDRRRIQLALLANETEQERLSLEAAVLDRDIAKDKRLLQKVQLTQLNEAMNGKAALIDRDNASPLHRYVTDLNADAANLNDQFQHVAVDGLQNMNDRLAEAGVKLIGLKGIAGDFVNTFIAGLLKIEIEQKLIKPLAAWMDSGGKGGLGGLFDSFFGGAGGGIKGVLGAFKSGLADGDSTSTMISGALAGLKLPRFANGGDLGIGGLGGVDRNLLSINGVPRAMVSADEHLRVVPANDRAANSNRPIVFDARGAVLTKDLLEQFEGIAANSGGRVLIGAAEANARGSRYRFNR